MEKNIPVNLKEAIHNLETLPAMPVIAQKILALNLDSDEGERQLLKLIEKDPQLAARIIGLANTPLFGSSKRVASVFDASMLLGITRVKAVTMGIAVMSSLIKKPSGKLDTQGLWLHSLAISLAMRTISRAMPRSSRPLDDELFLSGLLHDIGFMVLNHLDQNRSDELQTRFATKTEKSFDEIEAEMLEMNHSELGAELAQFWDLPESIITVIRYHHQPENKLAAQGQPLVNMINIAEKILTAIDDSGQTTVEINPNEWRLLGIDPALSSDLIELILKQAEEARQSGGSFP